MTVSAAPSFFTEDLEFSVYSRELAIPLAVGNSIIADALISLRASPGNNGQSVNDLRLRIGSTDLTTRFVTQITETLSTLPAGVLESSYRTGLQAWWKIAQSTGDYNDDAANAAVGHAMNAPASSIVSMMTQLGDIKDECRGNLHPINYLYNYIPISAISLEGLLPSPSSASPLSSGSVLFISQGPPITDPAWNPEVIGGIVSIGCLLQFDSPWADLEQTVQDIESVMGSIYNLVMVNGPIYSKLTSLSSAVDALRQQVNDCEVSVGSPSQITVINNTLIDIKRILNIQD
jgi:hypothetical protein